MGRLALTLFFSKERDGEMRKYLKMIRMGDLLIILFLMAASFLPLGVFS